MSRSMLIAVVVGYIALFVVYILSIPWFVRYFNWVMS